MANRRVKILGLFRRITGLSTPVGGIDWIPPVDERSIVRGVITHLEDRRALYVPYALEVAWQVTDSVEKMRQKLNEAIEGLPEESKATPALRAMRSACRRFLSEDHPDFRHVRYDLHPSPSRGRDEMSPGFMVSLGELRATFGHWILELGALYDLDVEEELASILPPEPS